MAYHAWILRSYACEPSEKVAKWITRTFAQPPYNAAIDHNEGDFFPDPDDDDTTPLWWFKYFKRRFEEVPFTIALLSTYLNRAEATEESGLCVVREILHAARDASSTPLDRLVPVLVNCSLEDLRRPIGEFEQLQDIVAPFVASTDPLSVSTVDWPPSDEFVELLASRLKVGPG